VLLIVWPPLFWQPDPWWLRRAHVALTYALCWQNLTGPMGFGDWFSVSWSLAVEEWFYLSASLLLLTGAAAFGRRTALAGLLLLFLVAPAIYRGAVLAPPNAPDSVLTALDQIAIGVAVAWLSLAAPGVFARAVWLLPVGLGLIALFWNIPVGLFGGNMHLRQALSFDFVGLGAAFCLPALAAWRQARGAAANAVRWLSARSYGFYITHMTVLELVAYYNRHGAVAGWVACAAAAAGIVALPVLSWRYVEQPALRLRPSSN